MKSRYRLIGEFKRVDACFQFLCLLFFCGALLAAPEAIRASVVLMAVYLLLSALFWLLALWKEPNIVKGGLALRLLMLVMALSFLGACMGNRILIRAMVMLRCSAISLAMLYFLITLLEISFYKKTAR
ncbi:hypothetical protein [Taibaiella koreensis]|uniref:hypothetical protein n=1 Tax=Taibaiella koreensis TaxID=1268548 RepID=UPI0013C2BC27|nr:hypothetical protein [Taibaiella koreensis]